MPAQKPNFGFKTISDYTDDELKQAVDFANAVCEEAGFTFYDVLRGVDAYFEKRRRKQLVAQPGPNGHNRFDADGKV